MIRKKKQNKKLDNADHGPIEKLQHGEFVEIETSIAGVRALRNTTHDPITYYQKNGMITEKQ